MCTDQVLCSRNELNDKLEEFFDTPNDSVIFGDFNICGQSEKNNSVGRLLSGYGYSQLVKEATHVKGRQIDHLYIKDQSEVVDLQRYSPYYTDHDAVLLSMNLEVTII